jgi:hypothetical protein
MEIAQIKHRIHLNKLLPDNPVTAECGVAEGNFSEYICKYWKPSLHYLVDFWGTLNTTGDGAFNQLWHNMNYHTMLWKIHPFEGKTRVLRGMTADMARHVADKSLDLVYIDAGHSYEAVRADLEAWFPKVKPGGVIAGHDFINPAYGVLQAVTQFASNHAIKVNVIPEEKDEDAGFWMYKPS